MKTENNTIIAEFMNFPKITNVRDSESGKYYDYQLPNNFNLILEQEIQIESNNGWGLVHQDYVFVRDLIFHSDWNWLMAVVEKIENIKIKDYSISTDITDDKTFINVWHYGDGGKWSILISNLNEEYKDFNKMQRTYKAVVKFINFYNKQKEE